MRASVRACVCVHTYVLPMQEEMVKVQAGVQLDINLEKSRSREEVTREGHVLSNTLLLFLLPLLLLSLDHSDEAGCQGH